MCTQAAQSEVALIIVCLLHTCALTQLKLTVLQL